MNVKIGQIYKVLESFRLPNNDPIHRGDKFIVATPNEKRIVEAHFKYFLLY